MAPAFLAVAWALAAAAFSLGCTHVDVKGREVFRVAPLRDVPVAALAVDPAPVTLDAGTDALTDEELGDIARALPAALGASFDRLAGERQARRLGQARIVGCRLRAGPGRAFTVYEARCRVKLDVDDVTVIAVEAQALRRAPVKPISEEEAERIRKLVRNPLLSAEEGRQALVAALDAAAVLVVDGALPLREDGPPQPKAVPRATRAALARERMTKLASGGDPRVALFDLRSAGDPGDAERVLPLLQATDPIVRAAAVEALGELCAPATAAPIEALPADEDERVKDAAARALERLRACGKLPP